MKMRTRWKHWRCANCQKRPGPLEGCGDGFPDLCDECWSLARQIGDAIGRLLVGWAR